MKNRRIQKLLGALFAGATFAQTIAAYAPVSLLDPFDRQLLIPSMVGDRHKTGVFLQFGSTDDGRNLNSDKVNVLQIYSPTENSIAMLRNPVDDPAPKLALANMLAGATDTLGQVRFCGKVQAWDVTPYASFCIPWCIFGGQLRTSLFLPIRDIKTYRITVTDTTDLTCPGGQDVHDLLSGNIVTKAAELGDLVLDNEANSGVGDLAFVLEWRRSFLQCRENLQNVTLYAQLGLTIPTGKQGHVDHPFRIPLGADGAWGMPLSLGLDLDFAGTITLGGNVQFYILFDNTKEYRLKTHFSQTDFLLLNKAKATKEHGLTWKFTLFGQSRHFYQGLSATFGYQYIKHDDDRLLAKTDDYNYAVVNSAGVLQEWNMHYLYFQANYDFNHDCCPSGTRPQLSLFYRLPVNGKGVVNPGMVGGQLSVDF